jgi:hypothetical protein
VSDPTANYHDGSATSVAANERAEHSRRSRMDAVEAEVLAAGPFGRTSEELERNTGISHQSMGGVILKLIQEKRIHRPGDKRKTSTGAMALVCYHGPGESVGRAPRTDKETLYAEILQQFTQALHHRRLDGPGREAAMKALREAGFKVQP